MSTQPERRFLDKLRSRDPKLLSEIESILTVFTLPESVQITSVSSHLAYYYDIALRQLGPLDSEFLPTIAKIQAACALLFEAITAKEALIALKKWLVKSKHWMETARSDPWLRLYALKAHIYALYIRAHILTQADKEVGFLLKTLPSESRVLNPSGQDEEDAQDKTHPPALLSKPTIMDTLNSVLDMTEIRSAIKVELCTEGYWWGGKFYDVAPWGVSSDVSEAKSHQAVRLSVLFELVSLANIIDHLPPGRAVNLPVCDPDLDGGIDDPLTELPRHILSRHGIVFTTDCSIRTVGGQLRPRQCLVFRSSGSLRSVWDGRGLGLLMGLVLKFSHQTTVKFARDLVLIEGLIDSVIAISDAIGNPVYWLDLSDNNLLNPHIDRIANLPLVPYIDLSGNKLNDDAVKSIDSVLASEDAKFLSIARNSFTEKSIIFIAKRLEDGSYAKNLRHLDFSNNPGISDALKLMDVFADALHTRRAAARQRSPSPPVGAFMESDDSEDSDDSEISASASVRRYTNKLAVRWRADRHPEISDAEILHHPGPVTHAISVRSIASHVHDSLNDARQALKEAHGNAAQMSQSAPRVVRLEKVKEKLKSHPFMQMHEDQEKLARLEMMAAKAAADAQGGVKGWGFLKRAAGSSGGAGSSAASISNIVSLLSSSKQLLSNSATSKPSG